MRLARVSRRQGVRAIGLASEKHRRLKFPRHAGHLSARTRVWSTESKSGRHAGPEHGACASIQAGFFNYRFGRQKMAGVLRVPRTHGDYGNALAGSGKGKAPSKVKKNAGFPQCRSGLVWVLGSGGYTSG